MELRGKTKFGELVTLLSEKDSYTIEVVSEADEKKKKKSDKDKKEPVGIGNYKNEFPKSSVDEAKAYIPITNIYDYQFPRTGELREEMERISREYTKDFRQYVFDYTQRFSATLLTYKLGDVVLEFI